MPLSETELPKKAQLTERIAPRFQRRETKQHVQDYLKGLRSSIERKNGWQIAEQASDETPYEIQHLVRRSVWDADAVRDETRTYMVGQLGHPEGVLVIDETGFVKKGNRRRRATVVPWHSQTG